MNRVWKLDFILIGILFLMLLSFSIYKSNVTFALNGEEIYTIEVNHQYNDLGTNPTIFNKLIDRNIEVINNVNVNELGTYYVDYKLHYLGSVYNIRREVNVVDTTNPVIMLNGKEEITLNKDDEYTEYGVIAYDNYDKDITDKVVITNNVDTSTTGEYEVVYSISDSSNNLDKKIRKVIVVNNVNTPKEELNKLEQYIKDNNLSVSVGYYNLTNGKTYYYNEDKLYYGASLIKTLDAIYLYDNDLVDNNLKEYIKKAISISDNDSHYYLVNYIGIDNLREYGVSLGASNTLVGYDKFGYTTVLDQIVYLKKLYELFKTNKELESYFINDYYNYLNFDNISFAHKYGYYSTTYHDVGIYLGNNPYIVVILTNEGVDNYGRVDVVTELSKLVYEYHNSM